MFLVNKTWYTDLAMNKFLATFGFVQQEESIRIGRNEIKNGKFIEHEKIMSNLKSC